ncbi:uroporphyrin-3 C-methyltransferase [Aromatoleum tolulyticum]|uniref:Uroporphyrin-3 C-methyltransferase n=1 Tax=Aromatoleum tolulyticum TaxID=34027 RepID=A0A1N6SMX9_9RHOO|nr:uroporphyrinogen-III C-methyltransferase [Aromatoleum tolulyticum]SIQ42404.1 uroporphyrin-3 C-methyltransferase [Aromatoleum tolulyticum]
MNQEQSALTQSSSSESAPAPNREAAGRPSASAAAGGSSRGGLAVAISVIALVGAGVLGWYVHDMRGSVAAVREEVAQRLAAGDSAATEYRALARQQQETIAALQGKLGALEAQVAATEGQAATLETLYQQFSRTREDRVIAEAEYAVAMAAQQLQLAGNAEAALVALQGAEGRIAAQDAGQLLPLRRALARDIEMLKAAPQVDVPGIALRLEGLLERVDGLPLAFAGELAAQPSVDGDTAAAPAAAAPSPMDFIKEVAHEVWHEILALVRIERLDQPEPVLLAPAQSTYLRENLKIRLLTARLALLARDGRTFSADLAQAQSWVGRYFDKRDAKVQETLSELAALAAMPVKVEQPAPVESIAALRLLQARAGEANRNAPAVAVPPAELPAKGSAAQQPAGAAR